MTLFGEKLKKLIDDNNINVLRLSQRAGIERTMVHKIISGDRMPDMDYIRTLADALPVSPFERDDLLEAYDISKDGEFLYNQRIQVRQLVERMSAVQAFLIDETAVFNNSREHGAKKRPRQIETVTGTLSVNNLINEMIDRELYADDPCVKFLMPHSYTFFYDTLFIKQLKTPTLKVECLFEFFKATDILREKRNVNLDIINALAPFIMHSGSFAAHYAYSVNPEGSMTASPMPYLIVTSKKVATFTADMQTAIALNNADAASYYGRIFESMKAKARPLIGQVTSMVETIEFYSANLGKGEGIAGFGSHPCITEYYDREILESHVPKDLPGREQVIEVSMLVCDGMQALSRICPTPSYFTLRGLELFVEQGRIQTIVEKFFSPYEPSERVDVIQRMISDTESDKVIHRVIDSSKIKIPERFYIDVFNGSHINIVVGSEDGDISTINIFEESIYNSFHDFLTNAVKTDLLYSKEDTLTTLHRALDRAKSLV